MKLSADTKMKLLLQSPAALAILEQYDPKLLHHPALQMTRGMRLRTVASFAQSGITPELLDRIDADLRALSAPDA